jgi:hypothetical protein
VSGRYCLKWQFSGKSKYFRPVTIKFLRAGDFPKMTQLVNFGAPSAIPQNLLSGVLSIPDTSARKAST